MKTYYLYDQGEHISRRELQELQEGFYSCSEAVTVTFTTWRQVPPEADGLILPDGIVADEETEQNIETFRHLGIPIFASGTSSTLFIS